MNNSERKQLQDLLKRRAEEHTDTAQAARDWLIREGLYDGEGKLLPQYGGASPEGAHD